MRQENPIILKRNKSTSDTIKVTFQLSAQCEGARAYIIVLDGSNVENETNNMNIPTDRDEKYNFRLPPGGSRLMFACGEGDGKCFYTEL